MKKNYTLYKKLLPVVAALILSCTAFNALAQEVTVNICPDDTVSLYARVPYNGAKPTYLWTVNGATKPNNTDSVFTYVPVDGDEIVCLVTPHPSDICLKPTYTPKYVIKEKCDKIFYQTCSNAPITFVAEEEDGIEILEYQWFVNGVAVAAPGQYDSTYTHTPNPNQIDTVYCIITPDDDCAEPATTSKYIITLHEPPTLYVATTDTVLCDTVPVIISGNTFGGAASKIEKITITNGGGSVAWSAPGSPFSITYTPVGSDTLIETIYLTVVTDSIAPCPPAVRTILLHINAKSVIKLPHTVSDVCSEDMFSFSVTLPAGATNITWIRATVPGISNPLENGTGSTVSEKLINTTKNDIIPVTYVFTFEIDTCTVTGTATILVKPKAPINAKIVVKKN